MIIHIKAFSRPRWKVDGRQSEDRTYYLMARMNDNPTWWTWWTQRGDELPVWSKTGTINWMGVNDGG